METEPAPSAGSEDRPLMPLALFKRIFSLHQKAPWTAQKADEISHLVTQELKTFDQVDMICGLLERFSVVNSTRLGELAAKTADHLVNEWKFEPAGHRIVAVSDAKESDGSQTFLQAIRTALMKKGPWKEGNFLSTIGEAAAQAKSNQRILLIDDFIGTGSKIKARVEWFRSQTISKENLQVFVCSIAAMKRAEEHLKALGLLYYSPLWLDRAISDYLPPPEATTQLALMLEVEKLLAPKFNGRYLSQFSLGFKKSETAFWIEPMNVPNNVFPVFWWRRHVTNRDRLTMFVAS